MATTFMDARDRVWSFRLTYGDVKRVKDMTQLNLAKPGNPLPENTDLSTLDEKDMPVHLRLAQDPLLLVEVVFAMISPQAIQQDVKESDFIDAVTPEVFHEISKIFWETYHDFFQASGNKIQAKMVEAIIKAMDRMGEKMAEADAAIDRKMEEIEREMDQQMSTTSP